jgi:hypothetical protein
MVGRRGIEPRYTCVSGRPRRPAGSRPAEGRGVDPPGRADPYRLSRPAAAPAAYPPWKRAAVPTRSAPWPAAFGVAPATLAGSLSTAEDGGHDPQGLRPHPLSRQGPPPGDFISHVRKAGDSNATGLTAHRLAGEPGILSGSPSVPHPGFEPGTSWSWARRLYQLV